MHTYQTTLASYPKHKTRVPNTRIPSISRKIYYFENAGADSNLIRQQSKSCLGPVAAVPVSQPH